jgi:hypothetical protein
MDIDRAKEKLGWRTIVNKPTQGIYIYLYSLSFLTFVF